MSSQRTRHIDRAQLPETPLFLLRLKNEECCGAPITMDPDSGEVSSARLHSKNCGKLGENYERARRREEHYRTFRRRGIKDQKRDGNRPNTLYTKRIADPLF